MNFVNISPPPPIFWEKHFVLSTYLYYSSRIIAPLRILDECIAQSSPLCSNILLCRWRFPHRPVEGWLWPQGEAGGGRRYGGLSCTGTARSSSLADPHHGDVDPDPSFHFDADQDPNFHFDVEPDPATHQSDANLRQLLYSTDPPSQPLALFRAFTAPGTLTLMLIRIRLFTLMRFRSRFSLWCKSGPHHCLEEQLCNLAGLSGLAKFSKVHKTKSMLSF